jgi:hypothetical protein
MTQFDPATTIDLSCYPLDRSDSDDYRSLVSGKRDELNDQQFCTMPGFLLDRRRREIAVAIEGQQENTYRADSERNVYLERSRSESLPEDHPGRASASN